MAESKGLNVAHARVTLGHMWGFDRPLTRAELGRALGLSPRFGGSHISKLERDLNPATLSGPIEVAIRMMLAGAKPHTMANVIKPGYPRTEVTV